MQEEEKKIKKKKTKWTMIKELWKNQKMRSIFFAIFYFVFFVGLFLLFHSVPGSGTSSGSSSNNEKTVIKDQEFSLLTDKNYQFIYTFTIDDQVSIYEGRQYQEKQHFVFLDHKEQQHFYYNGDLYLQYSYSLKEWIRASNPFLYPKFLDLVSIKNLIRESTYVSKTEFANGTVTRSYQIDTQTMCKVLGENDCNNGVEHNEIILTLQKGKIVGIEFSLKDYFRTMNSTVTEATLRLEYQKFHTIKDFDVSTILVEQD